jgi:hypothetical protein
MVVAKTKRVYSATWQVDVLQSVHFETLTA